MLHCVLVCIVLVYYYKTALNNCVWCAGVAERQRAFILQRESKDRSRSGLTGTAFLPWSAAKLCTYHITLRCKKSLTGAAENLKASA